MIPSPGLLLAAILLDALFGDPQSRLHPIRLLGGTLTRCEAYLRNRGWDGYGGGCALLALLAITWVLVPALVVGICYRWNRMAGRILHILVVYTLLALRDLVDHVRSVQQAARRDDLDGARAAVARFVGRDTDVMDFAACRRAAIESLGESFVDGFLSPICWYMLAGLPGLLLFKVVSTMDSMVGYTTPRYLRFGWCGARLDDVMNYVPARIAWLLLGLSATPIPRLSARRGWRVGLEQHAVVPGPNAGWSEATMAGVLRRRLIGPIWKQGHLVTDVWLGDPTDPPGGSDVDVNLALTVILVASCVLVLLIAAFLLI